MICYNTLADHLYHQGFYTVDNFLPVDTAKSLRDTALQLDSSGHFQQGKIGQQSLASNNPTIRADKLHWLDEDSNQPAIRDWFSATRAIANELNRQFFLGLVDFETHFALYPPGAFYKKHVDQFHNKQDRRISCVYYLNDNWHDDFGGHLHLYDKEDRKLATILPDANRLVCFLSDLPHEVAATTRTRLSIAGWMKTRPV